MSRRQHNLTVNPYSVTSKDLKEESSHGEYLDAISLFKLGQIDLIDLERALHTYRRCKQKYADKKILKKVDKQEYLP